MKNFNSKSFAIILSIVIFCLHCYSRTYIYNHWSNVVGWDVLSYYLYLPFTFIYHDIGMVNQSVVKHIFEQYNPSGTFYQAFQLPNGNWVPMYTLGFAILFSPFFFIGHAWALLSSYPADGFSFPYQFCISNGVMIYILSGIFFIRKVLLRFFTDKITILVMLFLLCGTNYFHESVVDETMPHAVLFSAISLVILLTIKWNENQSTKTSVLLGFVLGLTLLARGSEILLILFPLLWNVYDKNSFNEKVKLIVNKRNKVLIAIGFAFLAPLLQMIYWKHITGHFIFQSYQNTEGFDWLQPHFLKVLFSYKKSWFLYTPMIIFPIIGIIFMRKMKKEIFIPIFLFFIINFYMLSCWAAWWQGGSFGMRYFVESYAVMAIPFGFFLKKINEKKLLYKLSIFLITFFLLFLNLFQTWQFNNWIIDGYAMTKDYYWKVFLKTKVTEEDKKLKEIIRDFKSETFFENPQDYNKRTIGFMNFDSINSIYIDEAFIDSSRCVSRPNCCKMTKNYIYSPTFKMPFNVITKKEHAWIRVSFDYFPTSKFEDNPVSLAFQFNHNNRFTNGYKAFDINKKPNILNQWNHISFDYLTPYPLSETDVLEVYVWLRGDKDFYFDNFHIEAFERKW